MVWLTESPSILNQPVTTVLVAQAPDQTQNEIKAEVDRQKKRVMGVCTIVNGVEESTDEVRTEIWANAKARSYMNHYENKDWFITNSKTTIIDPPKHGRLTDDNYYPDKGFFGDDTIIAEVEENGITVEVRFFIHVLEYNEADPYYYCGEEVRREFNRQGQGNSWKISTSPSLDDLTYNYSLGSILAQTTGTDTNAAGYGWFVNNTPSLTDEFLPTSILNEWTAKINITGLVFPVIGR